eukprot:c7601_g1_i1.p3 GENE.c7601_g1_i1~~c7601_g1_i1.p3  ORF type:complete len:136 (+),score=22.24 c7601_g1_i1:252-659(+)
MFTAVPSSCLFFKRTTNTWRTDAVFGKGSGQTPLHWATESKHPRVVLELLRWGSELHASDERGRTAAEMVGVLDSAAAVATASIVRVESERPYTVLELVKSFAYASDEKSFRHADRMKPDRKRESEVASSDRKNA